MKQFKIRGKNYKLACTVLSIGIYVLYGVSRRIYSIGVLFYSVRVPQFYYVVRIANGCNCLGEVYVTMPSIPEEAEKCENCMNNSNVEPVREVTQTDHLNKKLLASYLNSINMIDAQQKCVNGDKEDDTPDEEKQNWES